MEFKSLKTITLVALTCMSQVGYASQKDAALGGSPERIVLSATEQEKNSGATQVEMLPPFRYSFEQFYLGVRNYFALVKQEEIKKEQARLAALCAEKERKEKAELRAMRDAIEAEQARREAIARQAAQEHAEHVKLASQRRAERARVRAEQGRRDALERVERGKQEQERAAQAKKEHERAKRQHKKEREKERRAEKNKERQATEEFLTQLAKKNEKLKKVIPTIFFYPESVSFLRKTFKYACECRDELAFVQCALSIADVDDQKDEKTSMAKFGFSNYKVEKGCYSGRVSVSYDKQAIEHHEDFVSYPNWVLQFGKGTVAIEQEGLLGKVDMGESSEDAVGTEIFFNNPRQGLMLLYKLSDEKAIWKEKNTAPVFVCLPNNTIHKVNGLTLYLSKK